MKTQFIFRINRFKFTEIPDNIFTRSSWILKFNLLFYDFISTTNTIILIGYLTKSPKSRKKENDNSNSNDFPIATVFKLQDKVLLIIQLLKNMLYH